MCDKVIQSHPDLGRYELLLVHNIYYQIYKLISENTD